MATAPLPAEGRIGRTALRVDDLEGTSAFYRDVVGHVLLEVRSLDALRDRLGASGYEPTRIDGAVAVRGRTRSRFGSEPRSEGRVGRRESVRRRHTAAPCRFWGSAG